MTYVEFKAVYENAPVLLIVIRRILRRHGGRVWAKGAPSRCARFHFVPGDVYGGQ